MRRIQQTFLVFVFVSSAMCFSAIAVHAQAMSSYLFLEVTDSNQKPVAGAQAETTVYNRNHYDQKSLQTDENGHAGFSGYYGGSQFLKPEFVINKPNYYPFQDFGASKNPVRRQIKIELLKIPKTKKERKALGNEELKRAFLWAVQNGDIETVRKLLKSGISPNLKINDLRGVSGYENVPAISYPAVAGDAPLIKLLLENGADVRQKDEYISNILNYYLQTDPLAKRPSAGEAEKTRLRLEYNESFEALIKAGADVNGGNSAPLISAIDYGRSDAVRILLAGGADINIKAYGNRTLLTLAKEQRANNKDRVEYGEIVKILEAAGAK